MVFLEYVLFEFRVQGSACESYFSPMKGWHGEEMGYQPASRGLLTTAWISKMLRGARRNFPSKFAEREAHWFFIKELFVPHDELSKGGVAMLRTFLPSVDWFDFLAEVVLESMVVCLMRMQGDVENDGDYRILGQWELNFGHFGGGQDRFHFACACKPS